MGFQGGRFHPKEENFLDFYKVCLTFDTIMERPPRSKRLKKVNIIASKLLAAKTEEVPVLEAYHLYDESRKPRTMEGSFHCHTVCTIVYVHKW